MVEVRLQMVRKLLHAARTGNCSEMASIYEVDGTVLDGTTKQGNTCLHIAALCGQEEFCCEVARLKPSLLSATNVEKETPLLTAVKSDRASSLAPVLLKKYLEHHLNEYLLKIDRHGNNVLHYAIRNGLRELALELIGKSPAALSYAVNHKGETPIFMAVLRRGFNVVYSKLLEKLQGTDEMMYSGTHGSNALHAAAKYGEEDFAVQLVRTKEHDLFLRLAGKHDNKHDTPMDLAAHYGRVKFLETMLDFNQSLGYHASELGFPLLFIAAGRGHVDFARKLLEFCPDAPYVDGHGRTCLHEAVLRNRVKFVEFILEKESKLCKLINMQDWEGNTALHFAVEKCNTKMIRTLLAHPHIDITMVNEDNCAALWRLNKLDDYIKTINWNKISALILEADDREKNDIYNLGEIIKDEADNQSRRDVKSLSDTYIGNTSLVAILIAAVTFAAGFTLPGGYSSGVGSEGLAIMARKLAFQAFLISDTLAMCCSLAVAFLCIKIGKTRSMDFEFLLQYRYFTKKLMWFAYMATTVAFATGLYTVLAPRALWLAITICVLSVLLPIMMMFMSGWQFKPRRGKHVDSKFLDMA